MGFQPIIDIKSRLTLFRIHVKAVLAKVVPPVKLGLLLKATAVFAKKDTMEPSVIQVSIYIILQVVI